MNELVTIFEQSLEKNIFVRAILSNPRQKDACKKIVIKPILLKGTTMLQFTRTEGQKEYHENVSLQLFNDKLYPYLMLFKQVQVFTLEADYHCLINKKGQPHIKKQAPTHTAAVSLDHNRTKNYILDDPSSHDFLKALGLMGEDGQIKPSKYDKYKQINRYLEFVADCTSFLSNDPVRIIDFGCGKSYLTFALYHYLKEILHKNVEVIGLDLKEDVIAFCNELASKLSYTDLHFQVGDIGHYTTKQRIDMVVSLHACNTATDAALEKAISWGAKVILAVPCCHHEAYTQIENTQMDSVLKHGILKERIAALVTDGLRAQLLETCGYDVKVMEFIDMAHTPKNILIRAILKNQVAFNAQSYHAFKETNDLFHLNLSLSKALEQQNLLK